MDVAEMVVRAIPEGVGEVQDELDGMTESVEESGEQMEETADNFGDLQKRFSGAGAAIAGAFAATTGLFLGRVPILSETIDALGAVFDSLGLKIDSLLRGALTRVNNFLFNLSDTIAGVQGPIGDLIGLFAGIGGAAVGAVSAFASLKIASLGLIGGLKATGAALLTVGKIIGGLIATIIGIKAAIAIALAAIVAFVAAYLTNWRGTRDKTNEIVGQIIDFVTSGFNTLVTKTKQILGGLVDNAAKWGRNLIARIISGIKSKAGQLQNAVSGINLTAGVTIGDVAGTVGGAFDSAADAGSDFIGSVGGGGGTINLAGRSIENTQGRYRADNLHRRGG